MTVGLALLCVTSQVSGLAHLAFVPHMTCAEHGELVELGTAPAPMLTPEALPRLAAAATTSLVEALAGHGHDHCLLTTLRRTPAELARTQAPGDGVRSDEPQARGSRTEAVPAALPVLAVAPKSSPPAT
jgi:hypothetical protein